jgi:hypothetical protein
VEIWGGREVCAQETGFPVLMPTLLLHANKTPVAELQCCNQLKCHCLIQEGRGMAVLSVISSVEKILHQNLGYIKVSV